MNLEIKESKSVEEPTVSLSLAMTEDGTVVVVAKDSGNDLEYCLVGFLDDGTTIPYIIPKDSSFRRDSMGTVLEKGLGGSSNET